MAHQLLILSRRANAEKRKLKDNLNMKMNQIYVLATVVVSLAVPAVMGSSITLNLDTAQFTALPGGEYNAVPAGTLVQPTTLVPYTPADVLAGYAATAKIGSGFQTFCLEENESFTPGKSYFTAINTGAVGGGVNLGHPGIIPGSIPSPKAPRGSTASSPRALLRVTTTPSAPVAWRLPRSCSRPSGGSRMRPL